MAENKFTEAIQEAIDTGYRIDNKKFITGPQHDCESWVGGDSFIWGLGRGRYHLEQGNILDPGGKPTGFFVRDDIIYGPSKKLPWFE